MSWATVGSTCTLHTIEDATEQTIRSELLLVSVLTGSQVTRQHHLRQAKIIQAEISERWQRQTPWAWQKKYVAWFLKHRLDRHSEATRYYYVLTKSCSFDFREIMEVQLNCLIVGSKFSGLN